MNILTERLNRYKNGDSKALEEITIQMSPLIKKYAGKIHCMEYDDALQELYLSLIECISYLHEDIPESKCLKYIQLTIIHKYYSLCKKFLSQPITVEIENCIEISDDKNDLTQDYLFYIDLFSYIESIKIKNYTKGQILHLSYISHHNDSEISKRLNITRQYVNRIKKKLIKEFIDTL